MASAPESPLSPTTEPVAATTVSGTRPKFSPTKAHLQVADALTSSEEAPTSFEELLNLTGVDPDFLSELLSNDHEGRSWIVDHAAGLAHLGLAAVYSKMFKNALSSKSAACAELFLKRFDPAYHKDPVSTENTQINIFNSWETHELEAFVRQKRQKVLGAK